MQFFAENKKKKIILLSIGIVILGLLIGFSVYFYNQKVAVDLSRSEASSGGTSDAVPFSVPVCSATTATLVVIKTVENDNTTNPGTKTASDFNITVTGTNPSPATFVGAGSPGTTVTIGSGSYSVDEAADTDYTKTRSADCSGTISAGQTKTCTITNNDVEVAAATAILTIKKQVTNDNGGNAGPGSFLIHIKSGSADVTGSPASGSLSGTAYTLNAGTYVVSEDAHTGYASAGITGDCASNGGIMLAAGDNKTCTITNNDNAPEAEPIINIVKSASPTSLAAGGGSVTYGYTVTNPGNVTLSDVSLTDNKCSSVSLISGDANSNSNLETSETWIYRCTTNLTATTTNTGTATGKYGTTPVTDTDQATVTVAAQQNNPLINIVKSASPTSLAAGGGSVTYGYVVTNTGDVTLTNVIVNDNFCSNVSYVSGDSNSNSNLETSETWTYQCTINLIATTTNTGTATGKFGTITVADTDQKTVTIANATPTPTPVPGVYNLTIQKLGQNLTKQETTPRNRVDANAGDLLRFTILVNSQSSVRVTNVVIRDALEAVLTYEPGSTQVNGVNYPDGITGSGLVIGAINPNEEFTITFRARVGSATLFSTGTTILVNIAYVRADGVAERDAKLPIYITKNIFVPIGNIKTGVDGITLTLLISTVLTSLFYVGRSGLGFLKDQAGIVSPLPTKAVVTLGTLLLLLAGSLGLSSKLKDSNITAIEIRSPSVHTSESYLALIGNRLKNR